MQIVTCTASGRLCEASHSSSEICRFEGQFLKALSMAIRFSECFPLAMERDCAMLTFQLIAVVTSVVATMNDQLCSMHSAVMKVF